MEIQVDKKGTIEEFNNTVTRVLENKSVKCLLILACDANELTPDKIDEHL
ncbi:MAG: hypothetical protein H8D45_30475 [Bacteroidetes bacterium]|nr:hypothetical protein [Bacteroidota bacterium]